MLRIREQSFNPVDYSFRWTEDGWYEFDSKAAHQEALEARNRFAKEKKDAGYKVKRSSMPNQIITLGGINTPYPEIDIIVTIYEVAWS